MIHDELIIFEDEFSDHLHNLLLGTFVDGKAGSNLLRRFSAGGVQLLVLS